MNRVPTNDVRRGAPSRPIRRFRPEGAELRNKAGRRRRALVAVLAAAITGGTVAQAPPLGNVDEPIRPILGGLAANTPFAYGLGDVDGDGDADLVLGAAPYLLLNDGHGTLGGAVGAGAGISGAVASPQRTRVVADLNGDGRADVATSVGPLNVYLSAGAAGHQLTQSISFGFSASIAADDVDGDGDVDLLLALPPVANQAGSTPVPVRLYLNNGAGVFTFAPGSGLPTSDGAAIATLDLDLDGDRDVIFTTSSTITAVLNDGTGVFAVLTTLPYSALGGGNLRVGDFDGNGLPDFLAWPSLGGSITVYLGAAAGPGSGWTYAPGSGIADVRAVDLDGDGADELVVATGAGVEAVGLVGGVPVRRSMTPLVGVGLSVGDLDGDGDVDVVAEARPPSASSFGVTGVRHLRAFFNDGAGGLRCVAPPLLPRDLAAAAVFGDFDGDGAGDVLGVSRESAPALALVLARNDGYGVFAWEDPPCAGCAPLPAGSAAAAALDFDLDGDLDVALHVAPSGGPHGLLLLANTGGGAFAAQPIIPLAGSATELVAADVDGDGDDDLISGEATSTGVRLVRNLGGGVFAAPVALGVTNVIDVDAADVDGDGDVDLVCAAATSRLLLNDGTGSFTIDPGFPNQNAVNASLGDLDFDGRPEVFLNANIYLRLAGGGWLFLGVLASGLPAGAGIFDYVVRDFDENGGVDAYVGSARLYHSASGGPLVLATLPAPVLREPLRAVDFDRDGDVDVLAQDATALVNHARHLVVEAPLRPGRPVRVRLFGAAGGAYTLFGSAPSFAPPFALPPFGTVFLDLATTVVFSFGALDAAGEAVVTSAVPATPALIGVELVLQGAVTAAPGLRLTNARKVPVESF